MKVVVTYFAILREQRGLPSETVDTSATTPAELYEELRDRHGFSLPASMVKAAVNGSFRSMDEPLEEGAKVVFIPPVAGG